MKNWLSIGQFARRTGLSPRALRLYEKKGLIASIERGENGYRYYRESQLAVARRICEMKALGFRLVEIQVLLTESHELKQHLERRLAALARDEQTLREQRTKIQDILSSIQSGGRKDALNRRERKYIMSLFTKAVITVTGVEDLVGTAKQIREHLVRAGQPADIIEWDGLAEIARGQGGPKIVVIDEKHLDGDGVRTLYPDVVVVKNVGAYSEKVIANYLRLYDHAGPHMTTVLNADDRASIEIAKSEVVRKGRIFYFSKNSGLKDQISQIGGIVSDGSEIELFGLQGRRSSQKIEDVLTHAQEVARLAALAAVMELVPGEEILPTL